MLRTRQRRAEDIRPPRHAQRRAAQGPQDDNRRAGLHGRARQGRPAAKPPRRPRGRPRRLHVAARPHSTGRDRPQGHQHRPLHHRDLPRRGAPKAAHGARGGLREHHEGLQQLLPLLHSAIHQGPREKPRPEEHHRRGARPAGPRIQRGDAARPERQLVPL